MNLCPNELMIWIGSRVDAVSCRPSTLHHHTHSALTIPCLNESSCCVWIETVDLCVGRTPWDLFRLGGWFVSPRAGTQALPHPLGALLMCVQCCGNRTRKPSVTSYTVYSLRGWTWLYFSAKWKIGVLIRLWTLPGAIMLLQNHHPSVMFWSACSWEYGPWEESCMINIAVKRSVSRFLFLHSLKN